MRLYARWPATAVPCRQRTAQSPLWSHNGVATAAPRRVTVAQAGVALRIHIRGRSRPLALFGAKETSSIIFTVRLAHTSSICLLAREGRTMPSTSSTVAVVESPPRGDRGYGGPRSRKGESPFVYISEGGAALSSCLVQRYFLSSLLYAWPVMRPYARWLATAVPCRQQATVAVVESQRRGDAATVGSGRSRGSRPSNAYQRVSHVLALFGAKILLVSSW